MTFTVGRTLVLGGSRSGKSAFAESLLAAASSVDYIATAAAADDEEWAARVDRHRQRRPAHWRTLETGDVAGELTATGDAALVDSVTTWLARVMDEAGCWMEPAHPHAATALAAAADRLVDAWTTTGRQVVAVSDEVGGGIVPESASGRQFRDALGELNQRLAQAADSVYFVVAGLPQRLK